MAFPNAREDRATALVAVALFVYVALRAACVPIVHDEAFSYRNFAGRSFAVILSNDTPEPANNHVLNSLLVRVSALAFGPSEWTLRLPNVLAFALYLVCGLALVRRLSGTAPRVCGFLLFAANPFLLELFSLSRGYGLGLAFLSAALLAYVKSEEEPGSAGPALVAGGASAFLAVAANLVFLLPVLALVAVMAVRNRGRVRVCTALALVPLLLAAALGPRIAALKRAGQFYAGGTEGFFADTVGALVQATEGDGRRALVHAAVVAATAGLLLLALVGILAPSDSGGRRITRIAGSVLLLGAAGSVAQHHLLGTPYLEDRTAIFFVPLLALSAAGGLDILGASPRSPVRLAGRTCAIVLAALAVALLVSAANVDRTTLWRYDADVRRVVDSVTALHDEGLGRIRIGGNWIYEPALNFYRETRRLAWLEPIIRSEPVGRCNVVLTSVHDRVPVPKGDFIERRVFPLSGAVLLVRSRPAGSGLLREDSRLTGSIDSPAEGETMRGTLRVRGWARIPGEDLRVTVYVDGLVREDASASRSPRPDVASAVPAVGDCASAGYQVLISFRPGDEGRHMIDVVFEAADGRERHYGGRLFTWER